MQHSFEEYQVIKEMKVPDTYRRNGFIYILSNECMPGVYKIGMTKNEPESRAKEISATTGVPTSFKVHAAFHSKNPRADEKMIHEALAASRVSDNREFFRLDEDALYSAKSELRALVGPERDEDVAVIAMYDSLISFCKEPEFDLEEMLIEQGLGGVCGEVASIKNFLLMVGINHVKDIISHKNASVVISPNGAVNLITNAETQWLEAQHDQQCSEG